MLRGWLLCCAGCSAVFGIDPAKPAADAPPPPSCTIGTYDLCGNQAAYGPLEFDADTTISTDRDCELVLYQPGTVSACVLYATEIHVAAGITVTPGGTRSLVLAATGAITIDGSVEASSYYSGNTNHTGPGANDPSCAVKRVAAESSNGSGGGAGGTFGGKGGDGGSGAAGAGGLASDVVAPPTFPRGGCPGDLAGSRNGNGFDAGSSDGGGALWITSATSVAISTSGRVLAGGGGGAAGSGAILGGASGAGGGGSGGFIHLAAPALTIAGVVAANGGGGGEGSFSGTNSQLGMPGEDGRPDATAAAGGKGGSSNGGDGGNGAAGAVLAGSAGMAAAATTGSVGGGGGGGAGIVQIVGNATTAGATISPPAQ